MTLIGFLLGGYLVIEDSGVKETLYADFPHLLDEPSERVALEESQIRSGNGQASFSGYLMTHNIRVSLLALSLGCFGGVDPLALLFYNGAILGAVCFDYIMAGEGVFLTAWLLPHGIVEIPAILIAGQGGFLLANTLVGRRDSRSLGERF